MSARSPAPRAPLAGGGFASPSGDWSPAPPAPLAGGVRLLASLGGYTEGVAEVIADCAFGAGRLALGRPGGKAAPFGRDSRVEMK